MCQCGSPRGSAVSSLCVDLDSANMGLQHLFDSLHAHCTKGPSLSPRPRACRMCPREPHWVTVAEQSWLLVRDVVHTRCVCVQQILYVTDPLVREMMQNLPCFSQF